LPSTVIMTAVPAQVAGVEQIALVSAPRYENSIHPVILGLCHELKIDEVYRISDPQAVAAMAWGTKTIPKVDKIVGPSSSYAQLAKREVFGLVDVDSFAGPSDVVIVADQGANPRWVAADMLSQAEHAPGAALLLTDSEQLGTEVLTQLQKQLQQLDRSQITAKCLTEHSAIIVTPNMDEAISLANDFAAEHLQIQCGENSHDIAKKIRNAGAIFIGPFSPVAVGDYYAGPSHTLPTRCTTRHFSPLSSNEFVKTSSIIEYDARMLVEASDDIIRLAETEGLDAHAKSVKMRVED
jgi:histidinol dehydrogenase